MSDPVTIRTALDADGPALFSLIGAIFNEYDGCVLDPDGIDHDLHAIATTSHAAGGEFWVAEAAGKMVGCIGYVIKGEGMAELKRLYVARHYRGQGLGARLARLVYDAAERLGAKQIELWSDTRFAEAHAFYLRHGFERLPETRTLNDPSNTTEYRFVKRL